MLTKEQKQKLIADLSFPWGTVSLKCDGYKVQLQVQKAGNLTYRVMTFVNGVFEGKWYSKEKSYPEQKFLRYHEKSFATPRQKAAMEKAIGKRRAQKDSWYNAKIGMYFPDWPSGKAAINHLCKVCESVEIEEPTP